MSSLSKTRFVAGLQCLRRLWWETHECDAPELVPDAARDAVFARGHRVGEVARTYVPGGVLIDGTPLSREERVEQTRKAVLAGAGVVYEASFFEDGVFVAVDILERVAGKFVLTEVKSTSHFKPEHVPDVAVQLHVLERAGLAVRRAEVMHLNPKCRYPHLGNLFVRKNVTRQARAWMRGISKRIQVMQNSLVADLPDVKVGDHCDTPYECSFKTRCWPELPEHHVSTLYRLTKKKMAKLKAAGHETIHDLPTDFKASGPTARQVASVRSGKLIADPGLAAALAAFKEPIACIDFETIMPAIPRWNGCRPYMTVPVQFSVHVGTRNDWKHHSWLAEGGDDPRPALADALLAACGGARTVLAYSAAFENQRIRELAEAAPRRAGELRALLGRVRDLLPVIRDHTYHPDFGGSFSLKSVLPVLVPGAGYDDLEVGDGLTAAANLETLLLNEASLAPQERHDLRKALLAYCERDTQAMVQLLDALRRLATT